MKINKAVANKLAKKFKLDLKTIPIDDWVFGLNVELEHG